MLGSLVVYVGLVLAGAGFGLIIKPIRRLGVWSRTRALSIAVAGLAIAGVGFTLPAPEARVDRAETRHDLVVPTWQFNEVHAIRIAAPPARVFEAIRQVRADEIFLFRDAPSRRRFAVYWRLIYPGSAIIRMSWLRAIERRAIASD